MQHTVRGWMGIFFDPPISINAHHQLVSCIYWSFSSARAFIVSEIWLQLLNALNVGNGLAPWLVFFGAEMLTTTDTCVGCCAPGIYYTLFSVYLSLRVVQHFLFIVYGWLLFVPGPRCQTLERGMKYEQDSVKTNFKGCCEGAMSYVSHAIVRHSNASQFTLDVPMLVNFIFLHKVSC